MERRIPNFLKKLFHSLPDNTKRKESLDSHRAWTSAPNTVELRSYLEARIEALMKEDEKVSPTSWFSFKWKACSNRARRDELRELLKDLQP